MLNKVILPHNFKMDDVPVKLMEVHSKGVDKSWLDKRAAMFDDKIKEIRPVKGKTHIHLVSTGDSETYGPNSNGDGWNGDAMEVSFPEPEKGGRKSEKLDGGLKKYHSTFKPGSRFVYKNHKDNKDTKKSSGEIVAEGYNDMMKRGELIIAVDDDKWGPEIEKLAKDEPVYFSIGAACPEDTCSICGHKRKTRAQSCDHLKNHMLEMTKTGHQVYAINDHYRFHDISGVYKPADKIAFSLRKVASAFQDSMELAEELGFEPYNALGGRLDGSHLAKLAKLEKRIEMCSEGSPESHLREACCQDDPDERDEECVKRMSQDPATSLADLARMRVVLPMELFFRLIMGPRFSEVEEHMSSAKSDLPGIFKELSDGGCDDDPLDYGGCCQPFSPSRGLAERLFDKFSMMDNPVKRRVHMMVIRIRPKMVKTASAPTAHGKVLARMYGRYLTATSREWSDAELMRMVASKS